MPQYPLLAGLFGPIRMSRAAIVWFRQSLLLFFPLLISTVGSSGATIFSDDFSTSTLNSPSPAGPTATATAYQLLSSKTWNPAPSIVSNSLRFGIGTTTSGHIEAQALFSATPVTLSAVGDYVELTVTFTNTSGLFAQSGHLGLGLYGSGGVAPLAGGMNGTAVTNTAGVTAGAQGWRGYVSRVAHNGGTHRLATRPAQSFAAGNNQDLVTEGSNSQSYTGAVNLASVASTLTVAPGSQLTENLRITLTAANICQIETRLYQGSNTFGTLLSSQSATGVSGGNFYNAFDALAIGWRATANTLATTIDIASITVSAQIAGSAVAGILFQQQPTDAAVGADISPPVTVVATNSAGAAVTNSAVTLGLTSGTGTLNGTTTHYTDASGVATFTNLSLSTPGAKQLQAVCGSATVTSDTFNILGAATAAFPGAEGAGAYATGGRGGDVYYVTTLADTGAGSLRSGISGAPASGRTICFKVAGNIALNSTLTINRPNLTIAGQTAPGDGICFQDYSFNIAANNVIVRHLRTRLGTNALQEADSMWINAGTNIIVDHLSASWSVDETLSASRRIANLTVQNCFITESLNNSIHVKGAHGYGGLISSASNVTYSYLRNLYAHNNSRNPRIGSDSQAGTLRLDFRNNVIYNYGGRAGYTGGTNEFCEVNYVGNYCIKGPSSSYNYILEGGALGTHVYQSGNYIDLNKNSLVDGANTGWAMFSGTYTQTNSPFSVPAATTESAAAAYQRVVALAGAMPWRRDANDQRIARTVRHQYGSLVDFVGAINQPTEYITNTGAVGVRGWPALVSEVAPTDTDSDGMPDYWELATGLNPNLPSDRNYTNVLTGYTRLEEHLNWLADAHALCDRNGGVDVSLRAATGGATNLAYSVGGSSNGTVSLLGDGYTARFTAAANTSGLAGFTFSATDPATAASFGPVDYGILITTTNAPVSNTAPVLAAITNHTLIAGNVVNFTCDVTDTDMPPQTIGFTLQNAPLGATLGTNTGTFNWRPTVAQSSTTNTLSIVATDSGIPAMSATQSFTVAVLPPVRPALEQAAVNAGAFRLTVTGDSGPDYTVQASTNLVSWLDLLTTNSPVPPFSWVDPEAGSFARRFYRAVLGP